MRIIHRLQLVLLLFPYFILSQSPILCPEQAFTVKIANEINIPSIADNMDGTITLIHPEQYITDIFANHEIYGFKRTFPTITTSPLNQYYDILCKSKDLINELYNSVPENVFLFEQNYIGTTIDNYAINFLDGKTFYLKSWCQDNNAMTENICPDDETHVPEDFILLVTFSYDAENELMNMVSNGITPCGNSFNIALKGGTGNNIIQLWESIPEIINETFPNPLPDCYSLESYLYDFFDIACSNSHDGDIQIYVDINTESITYSRYNMLQFDSHFTFQDTALSIENIGFNSIKIINDSEKEFINFGNIDNDKYFIEIFSILGIRVLNKTSFENNKINTSNLSSGLNFIKLSNSKGQNKVFKFIN